MTLLDELSGFEFEDVMEDVFRNLGYENVRQAPRVADEGRDIVMEETVDGATRAVVVECKHTDTVGRPVVQKLHSAVATYDFDGPKRGIVVTTGRFTGPAEEYAAELDAAGDPHPIQLIDGTDLRSIAEDVGLDLYNGRIEIVCEKTLRPTDPARSPAGPVRDAVHDIENLDATDLPEPDCVATFVPVVRIRAAIDATFETSVGVIHRVDERDEFVVAAVPDEPQLLDVDAAELVANNWHQTTTLDEESFAEPFDDVTVQRFGQTETEYKEWATERLCRRHTTTVSYTGDNNVTYTKECEPNRSDVSIQSISPVYLPRVRSLVSLGSYDYPYEYYAAGPSRETIEDGIRRCVHCGERDETLTFCENCGSINCDNHIETERLTGEPVCTGCAVTERFFLRQKYFYDEANRDQFRTEYEAMPIHRKALENTPLLAGVAALVVLLFVVFLAGV